MPVKVFYEFEICFNVNLSRGYWASTALGMSAGSLFWLTYYSCLDSIRWCRESFIHAKLGELLYELSLNFFIFQPSGIRSKNKNNAVLDILRPIFVCSLDKVSNCDRSKGKLKRFFICILSGQILGCLTVLLSVGLLRIHR